jgi:hypothetical protein
LDKERIKSFLATQIQNEIKKSNLNNVSSKSKTLFSKSKNITNEIETINASISKK